jgi:hypothetical protein
MDFFLALTRRDVRTYPQWLLFLSTCTHICNGRSRHAVLNYDTIDINHTFWIQDLFRPVTFLGDYWRFMVIHVFDEIL